MKSLKKVAKNSLHIGSGVDDIIDSNLKTKLDKYGQYGVDYSVAKEPTILETVMNTDESRNEDDIANNIFADIPKIKHDNTLGYYLSLYVGHVCKSDYRKKASSGGLVSWVAVKMLEKGEIDGFIHVKKSNTPGVLFEYGISRTVKEVRSGARSRYYPAELSKVLEEVKDKPGRYAVVGIPEIITELRLLAEKDETINERIKYYFGLVCGHQKTTKYAEAIAWEYGIKPGDLEDIDFRVKKETGRAIEYDMKFTGRVDGESRTFVVRNNEPFVSSWAHGFFKARFSDFTDNSFNELSDITFGDAWLEECEADPMGNNILIVRNKVLEKVIKDGIKEKELEADKVNKDTIIRSQQGLIHHTRDELPYRLNKELCRTGWAPKRRVAPSDALNEYRKKVQDARQQIAEKSHVYYEEAVERGDFQWFKDNMQEYVDEYDRLYGKYHAKKSRLRKVIDHSKTKKQKRADGAILTLTGYFNYGNVIQRYALQNFLKNNGYNFVSIVNDHRDGKSDFTIGRKVHLKTPLRFVKRFMNYQKPYWYVPKVEEINPEMYRNVNFINFVNRNIWIRSFDPSEDYKTYIVGSDQIWRNWWDNREILAYYFLGFLRGKKTKRIAYAASFGNDKIEDIMRQEDVEYIQPYLQAFDHISVREESGIDVLKTTWGINDAQAVIDPTLLLDADDYSRLINKTDTKHDKIQPIFTYILGETPQIKKFVRKIQDDRKQAVMGVRAHGGAENDILPPVELWLKGFRDAELVVTNSFHGMMLSIVNNTDFVIIGREAGGLSRILDFLSAYNIEGRFVDESSLGDFDISKLKPIDWVAVNKELKARRKDSAKWILDSVGRDK